MIGTKHFEKYTSEEEKKYNMKIKFKRENRWPKKGQGFSNCT